eukprot:TRINITY_DN2165_c0_g1_i1.p2 TRINITY_DN2165_c0_g1~~TRINITY_DN2165_c0_g1_i1.p2  ORF type:complete len:417 (+),score=106.90 TRINITY_DN2165_c0_g1_i1:126-1376(+)
MGASFSLNRCQKSPVVVVEGADRIRFTAPGTGSVGCIISNVPFTPDFSYFEYEIVDRGIECAIGIGVAHPEYSLSRMPGWEAKAVGYHGDDGKLFTQAGSGSPFGPICTTGDRMGCGVKFSPFTDKFEYVYFTRNGEFVGKTSAVGGLEVFYPIIGLHSHGETVRIITDAVFVPEAPTGAISFLRAIIKNDFEKVKSMIEAKEIDPSETTDEAFKEASPLSIAIQHTAPSIVTFLLEVGVNVNKADQMGNCALHEAVRTQQHESANALLLHHANPNARNSSGQTPLHVAVLVKDLEMVRLLIEYGAMIDVMDSRGMTPFSLSYGDIRSFIIGKADISVEMELVPRGNRKVNLSKFPGSVSELKGIFAKEFETEESDFSDYVEIYHPFFKDYVYVMAASQIDLSSKIRLSMKDKGAL